jgi:hypothetical protein
MVFPGKDVVGDTARFDLDFADFFKDLAGFQGAWSNSIEQIQDDESEKESFSKKEVTCQGTST